MLLKIISLHYTDFDKTQDVGEFQNMWNDDIEHFISE